MAISLIAGTVFGQVSDKSRLDIGKDLPKNLNINVSGYPLMGEFPRQINLNTKTDYTQFYRDLLLGRSSENKSSTVVNVAQKAKVSVESLADNIKFGNIFPNPADAYATLEYEVKEPFKSANITIMNMVGQVIQEFKLNANSKSIRINTSGYTSGIYMVQCVVDGRKVATKKLMVEHN